MAQFLRLKEIGLGTLGSSGMAPSKKQDFRRWKKKIKRGYRRELFF